MRHFYTLYFQEENDEENETDTQKESKRLK